MPIAQFFRDRPKFRFWALCVAAYLAGESLLRAGLMVHFGPPQGSIVPVLALGFVQDVATAILLGAPFLAGLYVLGPLWRARWAGWTGHAFLIAMLFTLIFGQIGQAVFWNEFDGRYNSVAVNYLIFPREVVGNIQQSFRLDIALGGTVVGALALYALLFRPLKPALGHHAKPGEAWRILAGVAAGAGASALVLVYLPKDPLGDRRANELADNGFARFVGAAITNDLDYDGHYIAMPDAEAVANVRSQVAQDNSRFLAPPGEDPLARRIESGRPMKALNVVMVFCESFGSVYMDDIDNGTGESISPRLTALGKDGLLFTNIYATGNRTVRGLEAVLTSFPPIPGISTSRRPGSQGMRSLPFEFRRFGYETAFLYGGRPIFDGMGSFWSGVGFQRVWGQSDVERADFTTAWGVADEYLYTEALRRMDALTSAGRPAFLSLLTVSNHRPYTYPEGRIDKDPKRKRRQNAATYSDWAFGDFIERARSKPWFDDTIFVFFGDHGPRVYGAGQVPVPSYRIPVLFYAPKHIPPERNPTLGGNLDVGPTLFGLLDASYDSRFFGVDLRRVKPGEGRVVMEHNFTVAYGDGKDVAMLLTGEKSRGYRMTLGPKDLEPSAAADPALLTKAVALTQTAHRLFYSGRYHER